MTGTTWIEESGLLYGPIMLTNTFAVGTVYQEVNVWVRANTPLLFVLPVVAETYDGVLNDIHGNHIRQEHVFSALESAATGSVAEGNVGGGTGMICHGFKGGIGTSQLDEADGLHPRSFGAGESGVEEKPDGRRRSRRTGACGLGSEYLVHGRGRTQQLDYCPRCY
jgi:L-aminopeptidase/D-esterase-like protein